MLSVLLKVTNTIPLSLLMELPAPPLLVAARKMTTTSHHLATKKQTVDLLLLVDQRTTTMTTIPCLFSGIEWFAGFRRISLYVKIQYR